MCIYIYIYTHIHHHTNMSHRAIRKKESAPKGGLHSIRYLLILGENSAYQEPICAVAA